MNWKWPLTRHEIDLGGTILGLEIVADPDAVLDAAVEDEREGRPATLPYWANLWPSGIALARWAFANVRPGQTVLDLGCGMGVVGAAAAKAGGIVTVADIEPDAVDLAVRNSGGRGVVFDFVTEQLDASFDWIFGADVLYEPQLAGPVLAFVVNHGGRAVLADPNRSSAEALLALGEFRAVTIEPGVRLIFVGPNKNTHAG
ncbi:MAG: methyltransferase [Planctomycetota bacterium]